MPYIKPEERQLIDPIISELDITNAGQLNYSITMICKKYLNMKGTNYNNINEVIGVLECAKLEAYRRIATPYEEIKMKENGDV